MKIIFEAMDSRHQSDVMHIFNYYIKAGTAAFASKALPESFYAMLMKKSENYPAYVLKNEDENVIGFCQLSAYSPFPAFVKSAEITYFVAPEYTGRGAGGECLARLEEDAKKIGITNLIAVVSNENIGSIEFHKKHGFSICGELKGIGHKLNRDFGIIYLQKKL